MLLLTWVVSRFIVFGLFLARTRWFSGQNLDAITAEEIRVRTGVVGYARLTILRRNGRLKVTCADSAGMNRRCAVFFRIIGRNICTDMAAASSFKCYLIKNIIYVK